MFRNLIPLLLIAGVLAGCGDYPAVHWAGGDSGVTPVLLPLEGDLLVAGPVTGPVTGSMPDARGAALAAQAAALMAAARRIGQP